MKILEKIQKEFIDCPDLTIKSYNISKNKVVDIVFLETVTSGDKINELLLKNLVSKISDSANNFDIDNTVAAPNTVKIKNYDEIEYYLTSGYAIIIDNNNLVLAFEARQNLFRSVSSPQVEGCINGPKDAFGENYIMNIGLIKRRIKSHSLKTKTINVGRKSNTTVGILYLEDVTNISLVDKIYEKLRLIDIDGIVDSSEIAHLLDGESRSIFPTIKFTERPDNAARQLLDGKVVIVVDNSTFALITPSFFIDFFHPTSDKYTKSTNVNFIKVIRMFAFLFTILGPGLYIALVNYNHEALPTNLLLNFATQRDSLPFPAFIEAFIIMVLSEILRESDLRFPSSYGSSISILGALVLGEAAVSAGIVSPIMIIIVSLSFVSSLTFTDIDMINALRYYRFTFLISGAMFGIFGIMLTFLVLLTKITSTYSITVPYTTPLAPFDKAYLKTTFYDVDDATLKRRSSVLVKNNEVKEK